MKNKTVDQLTQSEKDLILDIFTADKSEEEIMKDLETKLHPEIRDAASEYMLTLFAGPAS